MRSVCFGLVPKSTDSFNFVESHLDCLTGRNMIKEQSGYK